MQPAFIFDGRNTLDHEKLREVRGQGTQPALVAVGGWDWCLMAPATASSALPLFGPHGLRPGKATKPTLPGGARLPLLPSQIGFIVYALGKPLDPFLQRNYS